MFSVPLRHFPIQIVDPHPMPEPASSRRSMRTQPLARRRPSCRGPILMTWLCRIHRPTNGGALAMTKSMICDQCRYLAHEYYADTPPQKACRSCPQAGSCPRARAGSASGRSCGCGSRQGMGGAQSSRNQGAQMRRCAANDASHTSCDCGQSSCNRSEEHTSELQSPA